jgi:diguanylate cyclase (GGDEF)-like protein
MALPPARPAAAARSLLGRARWARAAAAPRAAGEAAAHGGAGGPPPAEEEVLAALAALQQAGASLGPEATQPLRAQVLAELARGRPDGAPERLGPGEEAAFELLDGLLRAVYEDAFLLDAVKERLARLAVPLHKVALLDEDFLQDVEHPARRMLDQLERLDPDAGGAPGQGAAWARVDPVLDRVQQEFDRDLGVIEEAAHRLDGILAEQAEQYQARVAEVVRASEAQQAVLRARRGGSGPATRPPPAELAEWVSRAKRLRVGDRLELGFGTPKAQVTRLAWVGQDQDAFVFVDRQGHKAANLSQQEVAMLLRRGSARLVQASDAPLVERALDGVMERVHRRLEAEASKDPSTGLLNAVGFERQLSVALQDVARRGVGHALCYIDLDRLRTLVDVHGPGVASRYVERVGEALRRAVPEGVELGRLGGDTFAALLREGGVESARSVAESCRKAVEEFRFEWDEGTVALTASVGVVLLQGEGLDARGVLQAAQSACRAAKDSGANRVRVYEQEDEGVRRRDDLREALARLLSALDAGRMPLRYQPIVPIQGDGTRMPHIEILLGLTGPDGRLVPAGDLAAAAEHYNQAVALDRLVIRETLRWMATHPEELARLGACAINLSGQSLSDDGLIGYVVDQFMQTRVPPGKVIFEVTETAAVVGLSSALEFIRTLRDLGCRFALDDFGSGHVSYAYLKTLPVDFVKIDGFFVKGMAENAHDYAVVKSIHEIAHVMGKLTVAEYVHSAEVVERLKGIGVDYAQGFLLGEPQMLLAPDASGHTLPLPGEAAGPDQDDTTLQLFA